MTDRSAIGGLDGQMDKASNEVRDILAKYDWSGMNSEQHTKFTSELYSIVQQGTNPELQKNTSRERERT